MFKAMYKVPNQEWQTLGTYPTKEKAQQKIAEISDILSDYNFKIVT